MSTCSAFRSTLGLGFITLTYMENGVCASFTWDLHNALWHRLTLYGTTSRFMAPPHALRHRLTLYGTASRFMAPPHALWHHLTQQQLDSCPSYKRRLAPYSLYGHHGRGDEEAEEDVGEDRRRKRERVTEQKFISDWFLLVDESSQSQTSSVCVCVCVCLFEKERQGPKIPLNIKCREKKCP